MRHVPVKHLRLLAVVAVAVSRLLLDGLLGNMLLRDILLWHLLELLLLLLLLLRYLLELLLLWLLLLLILRRLLLLELRLLVMMCLLSLLVRVGIDTGREALVCDGHGHHGQAQSGYEDTSHAGGVC